MCVCTRVNNMCVFVCACVSLQQVSIALDSLDKLSSLPVTAAILISNVDCVQNIRKVVCVYVHAFVVL